MQFHTTTLIPQNQAQHASFRVYWQSAEIQGSKEVWVKGQQYQVGQGIGQWDRLEVPTVIRAPHRCR